MKNLLLASSLASMLVGLASPHAHADITCQITDSRSNHLTYVFVGAVNNPAGVAEKSMDRNGNTTVSDPNNSPLWTVVGNTSYNNVTLRSRMDAEWAITFHVAPATNAGDASLWHNANELGRGHCWHIVGTNTIAGELPLDVPTPTASNVPPVQHDFNGNPLSSPPQVANANEDSVMLTGGDHGMHLQVQLGGHWVDMLLDTGAAIMSVPPALAGQLVSEGKAHYTGDNLNVTMADGSSHPERVIMIDAVSIGRHTRTNVAATVSEGMMLLPLPILNAIGKFTIDMANNKLTFGQ